MKTTIFEPVLSSLNGLVDSYQLVSFEEEVELHTIANGRLDACINLKGGLDWFMMDEFTTVPKMCFLPLTLGLNRVRVHPGSLILNIKFFPQVLTHERFRENRPIKPVAFETLLNQTLTKDLYQRLSDNIEAAALVVHLDNFIAQQFSFESSELNSVISKVILAIESKPEESLPISQIAEEEGLAFKTVQRHFKKSMGITAKTYQDLVRFQHAARMVQQKGNYRHGNLMEALGTDYYDQSHFVKACKRITGLRPKELFFKLPQSFTDVIFAN